MSLPVRNSNVTVVGAGRSGLAAAVLLSGKGAKVFVTDSQEIDTQRQATLIAAGVEFESGAHSDRALEADWLVVSPGVPSDSDLIAAAASRRTAVVSEIEVASWFCEAPIVGITGSNGKTTTATLSAHVFDASDRRCHLAGNIGQAFSGVVNEVQPEDVVVLEISSFQLDHIDEFRPKVGVLLNITPDHLDRYGGRFEAYAASKFRLYENQREGDSLVLNVDDEILQNRITDVPTGVVVHEISLDREVERGAFIRENNIVLRNGNQEEVLMQRQQAPVRGRHNMYNTLASAVAARIMEVRSDVIRESMARFQGVPHRLEFVREVDGVRYFNDSKATNVNAVWYALESFSERIILIAGGRDKGNDYSSLRQLVRRQVRTLVAIGEGADKLIKELGDDADQAIRSDSLEAAVQTARLLADEGDVVLLSPACASFDMFQNYEDRGDAFKRIVAEL